MIEKLRANKKAVGSVLVGVLALGIVGYTYFYLNDKPGAMNHSGHQMNAPISTMGDVVKLDAKAKQLAGVQTATAEVKALSKEVKTTGKIAMNESGRTYLTSRVEGRIDEVYAGAEGEYISSGQAIASVYSPAYVAAQEEYLLTLDNLKKLQGSSKDVVQVNKSLSDAAKRKLYLLGVSEEDIAQLERTRRAKDHMTIYAQFSGTIVEKLVQPGAYIMPGEKLYNLSELSNVWLYADIYEKDIASIEPGQAVTVTSEAYPGETFSGQVTLINPVMDDATRTVKVRVAMDNTRGKLRPNMLVNVSIHLPLGESVVVPESSLLDTGSRKVVFVAQDEETFVKRDVVIGKEADGYIQILSGIAPGETVVTAATFLLDSQTQLSNFSGHSGHSGHSGQ